MREALVILNYAEGSFKGCLSWIGLRRSWISWLVVGKVRFVDNGLKKLSELVNKKGEAIYSNNDDDWYRCPMNNKPVRIDPTQATKQKLYGFSELRCYNPNCDNILIGKDGKTKLGKIAHIEAALQGGARYNLKMSNDSRRHFDNLILICDECHCIIDNPENEKDYPVELLKEWKKEQEDKIKYLKLKKNFLKIAIEYLSDLDFPEQNILLKKSKKIPFDIDEKITYNDIKENKALIEDYKIYYHIINNLYNEI